MVALGNRTTTGKERNLKLRTLVTTDIVIHVGESPQHPNPKGVNMTKQVECPQCLELVPEHYMCDHGDVCESCDFDERLVVTAGVGLTSGLFL